MRRHQKCYVVLNESPPKLVQAVYYDKNCFTVGHVSYCQKGCRKTAYEAWHAFYRIKQAKIKKIQKQWETLEKQKQRLDKQMEIAIENMKEIIIRKSYGNS